MSSRCTGTPHRLRLWVLASLLAAPAAWAETSPYYIGGAINLSHDSNLYRLGDNQDSLLPPDRAKADTVTTVSLLAGIDQPIGRSRLYGNASLRKNYYADNEILDNDGYGLNLGLDWSAPERLSGSFKILANQNLARFYADSSGTVETKKNIENSDQFDARVQLGLSTVISSDLAYQYRRVSYTAPEYDYREYEQNALALGLRYHPVGALTLGGALRQTEAKYPQFFIGQPDPVDKQHRQDLDFMVDWVPSGVSTVNARLSHTRISYDTATHRDWSGPTGGITWNWKTTGKFTLISALLRETGQNSDFAYLAGGTSNQVADYSRITSSLNLRGNYEAAAKISVNSSLRLARRQLEDHVVRNDGTVSTSTGSDQSAILTLGARWTPTRSTQLGCDFSKERQRTDSPLSIPLHVTIYGCYGQITLQ